MKFFKKIKEWSPASKGIVIFLYSFALLEIILNLVYNKFSFLSLVNIFFVLLITSILALILGASFSHVSKKHSKDKVSSKHVKKKDFIYTKFHYQVDYESKLEERRKRTIDKEKVKKFFISLGILLACGIGYIPLTIFASKDVVKITSGNYVKAEATIKRVYVDKEENLSNLVYAYTDENGTEHLSSSGSSWGGIIFKEGSKVTVYYNVNNPEILLQLSDTVMFFMGALFFFFGGLLAAMGNMELEKPIPILFGFVFMMFATGLLVASSMAGGFGLIELFASGAMAYAMILFELLGIFIFGVGIYNLFKDKERRPSLLTRLKIRNELRKEGYFKEIKEYYRNKDKQIKEDKLNEVTLKDESALAVKTDKHEIIERFNTNKPKKKYKHFFCKECLPIILVIIIFGGVGFFMIFSGIKSVVEYSKYVEVKAKVIKLNTFVGEEGGLLATFDYEYYVDGVRYENESSYSQSASIAPNVGDTIKIRYKKDDPSIVIDGDFINYIMLFMGFIPFGVGVGFTIWLYFMTRYEVDPKKEADTNKQTNVIDKPEKVKIAKVEVKKKKNT